MQNNIQQLRERNSKASRSVQRLSLGCSGLQDLLIVFSKSVFFFLKMVEEQDIAMERRREAYRPGAQINFEGKTEKFRWSHWREKTGKILYKFVRDEVFPFIDEFTQWPHKYPPNFLGAKLLSDEVTLKRTVEIIDTIEFSNLDTDIKGDLYESLLSSIESAGELGSFYSSPYRPRNC